MVWFALTFVLVLGVSTLCWASVGVLRVASRRRTRRRRGRQALSPSDVAILIAARNEELVLGPTLRAATTIVPPTQVFVVSDASTDGTAAIAREHGARVMELVINRGKAGALVAGLRHFQLPRRFAVVMLLDADTLPSPDYLAGLQQFDDPDVVAVAGRARTLFDAKGAGVIGQLLLSYRERTYVAVQTLHKFGQAAARANAVTIVPGFASMYRTDILAEIDIAAPGLAIEDYNMTFEIHAKRLGRVAFDPSLSTAYTQDPDTFTEYIKQMSRWSLGFWQTVIRHRLQLRVFWLSMSFFAFEVLLSSLLLLLIVPVVVLALVVGALDSAGIETGVAAPIASLPILAVTLGIVLPDYLLTVYTAVATRRLRYLLMAPVFPILKVVDAAVCVRALTRALLATSDGVWSSPTRRMGADLGGRQVVLARDGHKV